MAKLRNVSADVLNVPLLGRDVDPDQVVDVPDDLLEAYAWPESVWQVVTKTKKTED